jgi:hypothetical protein
MKKVLFVLTAVAMVCFMATSAMAFNVNNRSAEMTENSLCDQAGTIKMSFDKSDWEDIHAYLNGLYPWTGDTHDYAEIRITITGTDLDFTSDRPTLCKDIQGSATATGVPHTGELVELDYSNVEISDNLGLPWGQDFQAYVWGEEDDTIIHVYITEIPESQPGVPYIVDWTDQDEIPWFRIGLYDELDGVTGQVTTEICADVHDFAGFAKLTISNETNPQGLIFTGDNEIGHFGPQNIELRDCIKNEGCYSSDTKQIQLCELSEDPTTQVVACPEYYECFVLDGDFPTDGEFEIEISTDTPGVYIRSITLSSYDSSYGWDYFEDDCETDADNGDCEWEAKCAHTSMSLELGEIMSEKLVFCVAYNVNVDEAILGDVVEFDVFAYTLPCGDLFSGTQVGATMIQCQGIEDTMYFPYVLSDTAPWNTGIVVTNLAPASIPADEMEVTFILTDKNGDTYTETVDNLTEVIWAGNMDATIAAFGWAPAAGSCWLKVITNFPVDGWCYHSNGVFGAGTLPRIDTQD